MQPTQSKNGHRDQLDQPPMRKRRSPIQMVSTEPCVVDDTDLMVVVLG